MSVCFVFASSLSKLQTFKETNLFMLAASYAFGFNIASSFFGVIKIKVHEKYPQYAPH